MAVGPGRPVSRMCAEPMWMPVDQVKPWHHGEIAKYRDIIGKAGIAQIE